MKLLSVSEVVKMCGGRLLQASRSDEIIKSVETDTRRLSEGSLFIALVGERFDGHDFVKTARDKGATAVLVSRPVVIEGISVIQVGDTLLGLQKLAAAYRKMLDLRVVAITGSNGKTSTKDMVRAILSKSASVTATQGNYNNHIGLPLSVLRSSDDDQYAVWELGMNHAGEIAPLAGIARPDIAIITNIGVAHIGFLGSREAIAQEKGALAEALAPDGVLILNAGDEFSSALAVRTSARVVYVGTEDSAVYATGINQGSRGTHFRLHCNDEVNEAFLPVPGHHMLSNALMAVAAGLESGIALPNIIQGLAEVELTPGRMQFLEFDGIQIINDAYNASPDSMIASLATVAAQAITGKRFAVLGAMGELGHESERAHREVGQFAQASGIDYICSVGDNARGLTDKLNPTSKQVVVHFNGQDEAAAFLRATARSGDLILVKGSLSAEMGKVLDNLTSCYA